MTRVAILTVTYGNRWKYLKQVIEAVHADEHVSHIVVVDNGSKDTELIMQAKDDHQKLIVIKEEKNIGSAGGFAHGLAHARTLDAEYVLLLDDDNVPEENAINFFLENLKSLGKERVVLCAHRPDIMPKESVFTHAPESSKPDKTFFNVFDESKIKGYVKRLFGKSQSSRETVFQPIVPSKGFVYGGSFLPMEAVRAAPLPDESLVLYGDDVAYSWGVYDAGYESYVCTRPIIRDIDMTFEEGDHVLGLFDQKTPVFKVYFRIRNMVRISRKYSKQSRLVLFLSIAAWVSGLFLYALVKGERGGYLKRASLIIRAVIDGYNEQASVPEEAKLP